MTTIRRLAAAAAACVSLAALSACSGASAHTASAPAPGSVGSTCGTTRTGANVPVVIKVAKGTVKCGTAMSVESAYATAIKDGKVTGNGGGAPVTVSDGWSCEGYPTPEVLRTGNASECHTASVEVVAVIELPSSGPSTSSGG